MELVRKKNGCQAATYAEEKKSAKRKRTKEPASVEHALRHVQHRKNDIMAFHVSDREELDLPFRKVTLFRDLEDGREITTDPADIRKEYGEVVEEHLAEIKAVCHRRGSDYDLLLTDEPLHRSLVRYLARRGGLR